MRRRFGRGRRGRSAGDEKRPPIDAARSFDAIVEAGLTGAASLTRVERDDIPDDLAVVGEGETAAGVSVLVGYAPRSGGDAVLAVLAEASRRAADGFTGEAVAIAPQWSIASRRRASQVAAQGFAFRSVVGPTVAAESDLMRDDEPNVVMPADRLSARQEDPAQRELCERAVTALEGLAAKHGGAVRGTGSAAELVVMARTAASLQYDGDALVLETWVPERSTSRLDAASLATAMDRLEGQLRKRLNDRRVRNGEEGVRADLAPALVAEAGLRCVSLWPVGRAELAVIDATGVGADGLPVVVAVREQLTLLGLGEILDATGQLQSLWPILLDGAGPPVRLESPRLLIAARSFDDAATSALSCLAFEHALYEIGTGRGRDARLSLRGTYEGGVRPERDQRAQRAERAERTETTEREGGGEGESRAPRSRGGRGRRRSGRDRAREDGRERSGGESTADARSDGDGSGKRDAEASAEPARFDEISLFDLDEETRVEGDGGRGDARRRRRGRGRRRTGRDTEGAEEGGEAPSGEAAEREAPDEEEPSVAAKAEGGREETASDGVDDDIVVDDDESLLQLSEDAPDPDEVSEPVYEDDDEGEESAAPKADERAALKPVEAKEAPRRPRRRAAIVAHADRTSIVAAILLARDVRLLEGFWVYPQDDLLTFLRSVAVDFHEETPIHVVGFAALPARDVIQAAALFGDRLDWYDHHEWPPEDLEGLRQAVGADRVHVHPGAASSLPAVLSDSTRRSRFSDKLVELSTGRFSQHDYERWGRVWWQRLGDLAGRTGERRSDVEPLLAGRPSDLAREAARVPSPPIPAEVEFLSSKDFRLVHFGGYTLVVVPTPAGLDRYLASRVARERYSAELSIAYYEGEDTVVLGGDEGRGQRGLELGNLTEYLAGKHAWVESLPKEDRVACMRIHDLASHPERLDEVIREIAMGRSVFEA